MEFDLLDWREAPMPGGRPVRTALLPRLPDGGFRAFVRFPAGWQRAEVGYYEVPEEFLIVEGELHLNGRTWKAGGYAWVPAFRRRKDLASPSGCVAFAWFASAPRWNPGEPAQAALGADVAFAHWSEAPSGRLYDGAEHRTWIANGRELVRVTGAQALRETLDLSNLAWRYGAFD